MASKQEKQVNKFIDKSRLFEGQLKEQIESYLIREYNKRGLNFSPSSPYGQILTVVDEIDKLQYFYLEDALNERNLLTAFKEKSIYGLARLTGHNPSRAISARGEISLKFKPGAKNIIPGNNIELQNYTILKCENNKKSYMIMLNSDSVFLPKTSNNSFYFNIIEGVLQTNTFFGDSTPLQSFNIPSPTSNIENNTVRVFVSGQEFKVHESLYDMRKDERAVIIKTGINGGVDIYFGNEDYGYIPDTGETIEVNWISSSGSQGNLGIASSDIILTFADEISDGFDGELDLNELFDISVTKTITMGANSENKELTKFLLNKNSRALVLANPENYIYFLSRYNQFKYVYAFNTFGDEYLDDDNIVYLFLLPDINKKVKSNSDYFTTDVGNFYLDEEEKDAVYDTINKSGQQLISTELLIIDPIITLYALNIFIRVYDDIPSEDVVKAEIVDKIGEYFLQIDRRDKIPRSDIVRIIEEIDGVDSVYVDFVSKKNEDALRDGFYFKTIDYTNKQTSDLLLDNLKKNSDSNTNINISNSLMQNQKVVLKPGENPNLGLDEFGDIVIGNKELPLVRGGFIDRNGVEYRDGIDTDNLSAINIIVKESIPRKGKFSTKSN
jgi:hypothetical protein